MALATWTIREGSTKDIDIQLTEHDNDDDTGTPVDLTGATFADLRCESKNQTHLINFASTDNPVKFQIVDHQNGICRFSPAGDEFQVSEGYYNVFVFITDAANDVVDFPNDGNYQFVMERRF